MIISKTPYRISFFGGGTDFPDWFKHNPGAVLSCSIDKYCYISLRKLPPFFSHKHRIVYSDIELTNEVSEIRHPSVRECFKLLGIKDGLEVHHDGDLPSRSGLGSSSSFTVGLINALKAYQQQMISHERLSELAIYVERNVLGECGGIQDQIAVAHGGLNHIQFYPGQHTVKPLILSTESQRELQRSLCLFFTGKSRTSEEIERSKLETLADKEDELHAIYQLVDEGIRTLQSKNFEAKDFGKLLHENWLLKKSLAKEVSNSAVDEIYSRAMYLGAYGGKLLGAGGGGFFLFSVDPYERDSFIEQMEPLLHVPFSFEYSGSQIALYQP